MRIRRTDGNQAELVDEIRKLGFTVTTTHTIGKGFPDLIMLAKGRLYMLEVKDPGQPKSGQKLTPDEEKFHKEWPVHVVCTIDDIIKIVNK